MAIPRQNSLSDPERLEVLAGFGVLDTRPDADFDRLTRLAARLLKTPIALVSLVTEDRQFFKSCPGLPEPWATRQETPLTHSFCKHVVRTAEPLIIEDAREHPLVRENLAVSELGVIAYLGIPLITERGHVLGSFCVIDTKPRTWTTDEIETLRDLSSSVMTQIRLCGELKIQASHLDQANALVESQEFSRRLVESSPDCLKVMDLEGHLQSMNEYGCKLMEIDDFSKFVGEDWAGLWPEETQSKVRATLTAAREGLVSNFQGFARTAKGTGKWWDVSVSPVLNAAGNPERILSVSRDVTAQKLAEQDAKLKHEELTDFFENATLGLHWVGPDGTILWANRAELNLLGYRSEEYIGRNITEFHADSPVIDDILQRLTRNEELNSYEARLRCKDGSIREVLISSNVCLKDGKFDHTRCFTLDVTERKRLEREYHRQQEYWHVALSSIGDAVIVTDAAGQVVFMNPVADTLCGCSGGQGIGKPLSDVFRIVNESSRIPVESPVEKVIREGAIVGLAKHTILLGNNGKETPIDDSTAPIRDEQGNIIGVVLVFRDVAEKRRAEETRERLAAIVDSSDDVIVSKDLAGIIKTWNRGAVRVLGYSAEEAIGQHVSMLMPPEALEDMKSILGRIAKGESIEHYETKRRRKDGVVIDVSLTVSPIRDAEGKVIGASKVGRDITLLKHLEHERRNADRHKDEFLAMLAHELRNPLAAISNAVRLAANPKATAYIPESLGIIDRQSTNLTRMIDDLLDVSRVSQGKIELKRTVVDLLNVVNQAAKAARPLIDQKHHELVVRTASGPLRVDGDSTRLEQIVGNLLTNAAKYTEPRGRITLSAEREGDETVVRVEDTGVGIPEKMLPKVFDLFTQVDDSLGRSEGGLGIGLMLVKRLVEMHGGTVSVESELGKGSVFTVRLRALDLEVDAVQTAGPSQVSGAGKRVLIVDDNEDSAKSLKRYLSLFGFAVRVVNDGQEAIEIARTYRPQVVLLDIGLPGLNGYEVARCLRKEECCADTDIIAVSGYGDELSREQGRDAGFDHHLTKPIDIDQLVTLVGQKSRS